MAGVIITGHGRFAEGMADSIRMLIGKQDFLKTVNFEDGHSEDILKDNLLKAYDAIENKNAVFILCDILGGSPFKNTVTAFFHHENVKILYGTNLGMAIEACMKCMILEDNSNIDYIADEIAEAGKTNVGKFTYQEPITHEEPEDGI